MIVVDTNVVVYFFMEGEHDVDMAIALELSVTHGISAYDAQSVALAQAPGTNRVTADRRPRQRIAEFAVSLLPAGAS